MSQPYGPSQPVTGIAFFFYFTPHPALIFLISQPLIGSNLNICVAGGDEGS
jgi:hypothetical protein